MRFFDRRSGDSPGSPGPTASNRACFVFAMIDFLRVRGRFRLPGRPPRRCPSTITTLFVVACFGCVTGAGQADGGSPVKTIEIPLQLETGGSLRGAVLDHNDEAIVVEAEGRPFVFGWDEIETASAFAARRALLAMERGGRENLTPTDHFELGLFALDRDRFSAAQRSFGQARTVDPDLAPAIERALDQYRQRRRAAAHEPEDDAAAGDLDDEVESDQSGPDGDSKSGFAPLPRGDGLTPLPPEDRERVMEIYHGFGDSVRENICGNLKLIETEHFLIWTDWGGYDRDRLGPWCEAMFEKLRRQFRLPADDRVFLAKCPIFCWQSMARFRRFARMYDSFEADNAIGYTRSMEATGHVHVVLLRQGRSPADYDRFAATLVHEGTHAFVHRLYSTRLIPHWVNEGLAEWVSEKVLGERCPAGEKADLLARQYVRFDWPIEGFLASSAPLAVEQYPLAHSVVWFLLDRDEDAFIGLVRSLKEGKMITQALADNYDGLTLAGLDRAWREWASRRDATNVPDWTDDG